MEIKEVALSCVDSKGGVCQAHILSLTTTALPVASLWTSFLQRGPSSFSIYLFDGPTYFLGLSQEKDSPVIPGASSRGLGLSCPFLGLSVAWSPLKISPFRRPNCRPHCQLLAGYHGNRSQEGSAFLPPWMRRSRGLCEGQRFLLHGQEGTGFGWWGLHSLPKDPTLSQHKIANFSFWRMTVLIWNSNLFSFLIADVPFLLWNDSDRKNGLNDVITW